jgi:hypothetical protein
MAQQPEILVIVSLFICDVPLKVLSVLQQIAFELIGTGMDAAERSELTRLFRLRFSDLAGIACCSQYHLSCQQEYEKEPNIFILSP